MSKSQIILGQDQLPLVATLAYVGYPVRYTGPFENTYLVSDPGDASDLISDFESEEGQGISNAKKLLSLYDELLKRAPSRGEHAELPPPKKADIEPGREWSTQTISDAIILLWAGYPLLRTRIESDKVTLIFGYDDELKAVLAKFSNRQLRIEPHEIFDASHQIRKVMRAAKERPEGRA
jgi:hypothetical protein